MYLSRSSLVCFLGLLVPHFSLETICSKSVHCVMSFLWYLEALLKGFCDKIVKSFLTREM